VGHENCVVLAQTDFLDFQVHVRVDHSGVLDLTAELGVHAQLALVVVAPQEESLRLRYPC